MNHVEHALNMTYDSVKLLFDDSRTTVTSKIVVDAFENTISYVFENFELMPYMSEDVLKHKAATKTFTDDEFALIEEIKGALETLTRRPVMDISALTAYPSTYSETVVPIVIVKVLMNMTDAITVAKIQKTSTWRKWYDYYSDLIVFCMGYYDETA